MIKRVEDDYVYLDYAATAPLGEAAFRAMEPLLEAGIGNIAVNANPNSLHRPGRFAFDELESARRDISSCLGAKRPSEIVFTSGATEADNAAIRGIAYAAADMRAKSQGSQKKPKVITSMIEHDAVLSTVAPLKNDGFEVVYLKPDRDGFVDVRSLEREIDDDTVLVSVQMANSEIGSVQPIKELSALAHKHGALFHTDAVQALGKIPVDLVALDVDAASFSAHKIGGPRGIGALYLKSRTPYQAQLLGGGQEGGKRSGTQNVFCAMGFAAACREAVSAQADEWTRLAHLRDELYERLCTFDGIEATVDVEAMSQDYLPNIVNVMIDGLESETLVLRFDALGFAVSGGSACSSHSLSPSHVLTSMGIDADKALCALRISMGKYTTQEEIDRFCETMSKVIEW